MYVIEKKKKTKIKTRRKLQKYSNEKTFDQRAIASVRSGEKRKGEGKHSSIRNAFPISSSDISNVVEGDEEEEEEKEEKRILFPLVVTYVRVSTNGKSKLILLFSSVIHVCTYN